MVNQQRTNSAVSRTISGMVGRLGVTPRFIM